MCVYLISYKPLFADHPVVCHYGGSTSSVVKWSKNKNKFRARPDSILSQWHRTWCRLVCVETAAQSRADNSGHLLCVKLYFRWL